MVRSVLSEVELWEYASIAYDAVNCAAVPSSVGGGGGGPNGSTPTNGGEALMPPPTRPRVKPIEVTVGDRSTAILRGIELLVNHHKMSSSLTAQLLSQCRAYLDTSIDEGVWLKKVKYLLAFPLSKYLKCEDPPKPDELPEFSGRVRVWMRNRLSVFNRRNTHLWFSWFQCKRSSLEASGDFVKKTYDDHLKSLTSPDPGVDETIEAIFADQTFLRVLEEIRRSINKKFKGPSFIKATPTKSACHECIRMDGGQLGQLRRYAGIEDGLTMRKHGHLPIGYTEFARMVTIPHLCKQDGTIEHNVVQEVHEPYGSEEWKSLLDRRLKEDVTVPNKCTIQAVLEPLKVRVISKHLVIPTTVMRPLQKAIHRAMRNMPCFKLMGRAVSPTDLCDLAEGAEPDDGWLSIDYSAATDGLSWKFSGRILRYIIQDLDQFDQDMALKVLGPHELYYPTGRGTVWYGGLQTNGQLMGSNLSFPILCLANLGVYLLNNQMRHKGMTYERILSRVNVNGDDMLYVGSRQDYANHAVLSGHVGLAMSVGKAYWHQVYANINSMSFHYALHKKNSTPWRIPFLNTGLFFGVHKVQKDDKRANGIETDTASAHTGTAPNLVGNLNLILDGTLPGRQCEILAKFIAINAEYIRDETLCEGRSLRSNGTLKKAFFSRNLFLHTSLGGMGVVPPVGFRYKITKIQRELAAAHVGRYSLPISIGYPLPEGYEPEAFSNDLERPWHKPEPKQYELKDFGKLGTRMSRFNADQTYAAGVKFFTDRAGVMRK